MVHASWVSAGGAAEGNVAPGRSLVLSYGWEGDPGDQAGHVIGSLSPALEAGLFHVLPSLCGMENGRRKMS